MFSKDKVKICDDAKGHNKLGLLTTMATFRALINSHKQSENRVNVAYV